VNSAKKTRTIIIGKMNVDSLSDNVIMYKPISAQRINKYGIDSGEIICRKSVTSNEVLVAKSILKKIG
jgi:hypothetical protein